MYDTLSIEIPFSKVTVVANVCLATWKVSFLFKPAFCAIIFKLRLVYWFEGHGKVVCLLIASGDNLYFCRRANAGGNIKT